MDPRVARAHASGRRSRRGRRRLGPIGALDVQGMRWFSGVLRTADLVSDTILVTDAQLLDGAFFASLGPTRVHSLLGRVDTDAPALTVLGRGPSLEESLRSMAVGPAEPTAFTWSVLSTFRPAGERLTELLTNKHVDRIRSAEVGAVAKTIGSAWVDLLGSPTHAGSVRHLTAMWQAWVAAEHAGSWLSSDTPKRPPPGGTSALPGGHAQAAALGSAPCSTSLPTFPSAAMHCDV